MPAQPAERPAKPLLWARAGAFVLDILILHAVLLGAIKLAPEITVRLGYVGPWIGLAAGILYFGIGSSSVMHGRTVGKLVLRMHVTDIAGPDLPVARGLLRAALYFWPLAVLTILRAFTELNTPTDRFSPFIYLPDVGVGLCAGWVIGNFMHAVMDPFGRTWADRVAGAVVVSAEAPPLVFQDYVRSIREFTDPARLRRATMMLVLVTLALLGLAAYKYFMIKGDVAKMSVNDRRLIDKHMEEQAVPGFGRPSLPIGVAAGKRRTGFFGIEESDEPSTAVIFQYARRSPVEKSELEANPRAQTAVDRLGKFYQDRFREDLEKGVQPRTNEEKLKFRTTFAEFSDLLFAWNARDVYRVEKMVEFNKPDTAKHAGTTATIELETTGTAAAAVTSPTVTVSPTAATEATTETAK